MTTLRFVLLIILMLEGFALSFILGLSVGQDKTRKLLSGMFDELKEIRKKNCPKCGWCDRSCDNCDYCGTSPETGI